MPADDFLDADVVADDELGSANPHGPASLNHRMLATGLIRLLGIKSLGDAFTDPADPADPNGFYKLVQAMGGDITSLVAAFGDDATDHTVIYLLEAIASLLAIGNTNTATIAVKLFAIDTDLQAIAAVLANGNTNTAAIAGQLVSVNANLVDLVAETAANS